MGLCFFLVCGCVGCGFVFWAFGSMGACMWVRVFVGRVFACLHFCVCLCVCVSVGLSKFIYVYLGVRL